MDTGVPGIPVQSFKNHATFIQGIVRRATGLVSDNIMSHPCDITDIVHISPTVSYVFCIGNVVSSI